MLVGASVSCSSTFSVGHRTTVSDNVRGFGFLRSPEVSPYNWMAPSALCPPSQRRIGPGRLLRGRPAGPADGVALTTAARARRRPTRSYATPPPLEEWPPDGSPIAATYSATQLAKLLSR